MGFPKELLSKGPAKITTERILILLWNQHQELVFRHPSYISFVI